LIAGVKSGSVWAVSVGLPLSLVCHCSLAALSATSLHRSPSELFKAATRSVIKYTSAFFDVQKMTVE